MTDSSNNSFSNQETVNVDDMIVKVLIICKDKSRMAVVSNFLNRRGWPTHVVDRIDQAIKHLAKDKYDYVLVSANHPNPKLAVLPVFLAQTFNLETVAFGEVLDIQTVDKINKTRADHKILNPISGPTLHRKILQILKERFETPQVTEAAPADVPVTEAHQNASSGDETIPTLRQRRLGASKKKSAAEREKERRILERIDQVLKQVNDDPETIKTPTNVVGVEKKKKSKTTIITGNPTSKQNMTALSVAEEGDDKKNATHLTQPGSAMPEAGSSLAKGYGNRSATIVQKGKKRKKSGLNIVESETESNDLLLNRGAKKQKGNLTTNPTESNTEGAIVQKGADPVTKGAYVQKGPQGTAGTPATGLPEADNKGSDVIQPGVISNIESARSKSSGDKVGTQIDEGRNEPSILSSKSNPLPGKNQKHDVASLQAPRLEKDSDEDLRSLMSEIMDDTTETTSVEEASAGRSMQMDLESDSEQEGASPRAAADLKVTEAQQKTGIEGAIEAALKNAVDRPSSQTKHLVVATDVYVISVLSEELSGFIVVSTSEEGDSQTELFKKFDVNIKQELDKFLSQGKMSKGVEISCGNLPIEEWAKLNTDFHCKQKHKRGEVLATFFKSSEELPRFKSSTIFVDRSELSYRDMHANLEVPCDLFLYMSANNKLLHYVTKGHSLNERQVEKLKTAEKELLFSQTEKDKMTAAFIKRILFAKTVSSKTEDPAA